MRAAAIILALAPLALAINSCNYHDVYWHAISTDSSDGSTCVPGYPCGRAVQLSGDIWGVMAYDQSSGVVRWSESELCMWNLGRRKRNSTDMADEEDMPNNKDMKGYVRVPGPDGKVFVVKPEEKEALEAKLRDGEEDEQYYYAAYYYYTAKWSVQNVYYFPRYKSVMGKLWRRGKAKYSRYGWQYSTDKAKHVYTSGRDDEEVELTTAEWHQSYATGFAFDGYLTMTATSAQLQAVVISGIAPEVMAEVSQSILDYTQEVCNECYTDATTVYMLEFTPNLLLDLSYDIGGARWGICPGFHDTYYNRVVAPRTSKQVLQHYVYPSRTLYDSNTISVNSNYFYRVTTYPLSFISLSYSMLSIYSLNTYTFSASFTMTTGRRNTTAEISENGLGPDGYPLGPE